ncbi:hypothetical protein [Haloarcula pellucida]|uniref:Uncharacterized protein n=1 Tax=Haloarcula pellucida TaxID=1427151 RepID=A0A830GIJ7_9EURY|nr:hypothetical protein [Halomicroarcula pellucida]MBX0346993.1 hypothetical protein [Halomicroarcula pellucida]GGN86452.1 hypothetical protein GCM10009030_04140 [Halomicroarcula pellucida]
MNRRRYLAGIGGGLAALVGATAVADATRADIAADGALHRPSGAPVETTKTVDADAVTYLPDRDAVREDGGTEPFGEWVRWTAFEHAAERVVPTVEDRLDEPDAGLGRGIRSLVFGLVVTVDYGTTRNRDGEVVSEPTVPLDRVLSVAPRTVTVTVELDGRSAVRGVPVAVEETATQYLDG